MQILETIKNWGPALRVRKNHALEHATLQVLAEQKKGRRGLAGLSDARGFWVFGEIDTEDLIAALEEARERLNKGERRLAIHPNCGTNFAIAGVIGGLLAWLAMLGASKSWRDRMDRLPAVITLVTLGVVAAQPLGPRLQEAVTTEARLGDLKVYEVQRFVERRPPAHRVLTKG